MTNAAPQSLALDPHLRHTDELENWQELQGVEFDVSGIQVTAGHEQKGGKYSSNGLGKKSGYVYAIEVKI